MFEGQAWCPPTACRQHAGDHLWRLLGRTLSDHRHCRSAPGPGAGCGRPDPQKSKVIGKIGYARWPKGPAGKRVTSIWNWSFPVNAALSERKKEVPRRRQLMRFSCREAGLALAWCLVWHTATELTATAEPDAKRALLREREPVATHRSIRMGHL
jgi:hypothetical protein